MPKCPECNHDELKSITEPDNSLVYVCPVCDWVGDQSALPRKLEPITENLGKLWEEYHKCQHVNIPLTDGIRFWREEYQDNDSGYSCRLYTNVPRYVDDGTGFEWGYAGSGPTRFALNIVEAILRNEGHIGKVVQAKDVLGHLWTGECYRDSIRLRHGFKAVYVALAQKDSNTWSYDMIRNYVMGMLGVNQ